MKLLECIGRYGNDFIAINPKLSPVEGIRVINYSIRLYVVKDILCDIASMPRGYALLHGFAPSFACLPLL